MIAPPSSRSVDPRLAAAGGLMRDTVGAIHNLQHLLGSVRVGPKALSRVIPDVHASCAPMVTAARDLVPTARARVECSSSVGELAELVVTRLKELERALERARGATLRASDRLTLEGTVGKVVKDLDGALELVELLVEASATGRVPVDVTDVVRESGVRPDTGSGRGKRVRVSLESRDAPLLVRVNPRVALRVFAFAVAATEGRDAVHAVAFRDGDVCRVRIEPARSPSETFLVPTPPLISLSLRCATEVARGAGGSLDSTAAPSTATLTFPIAEHEP